MKLLKTFSKRYCFQIVASYLVVCCLFVMVCYLFYSMSPSATLAGQNGKAFGHGKFHGNPYSNLPSSDILTPINIKVNPRGIIAGSGGFGGKGTVSNIPNTGVVANPSGYVMNGCGGGCNVGITKGNYGNISSPHSESPCTTTDCQVNPAGTIVGTAGAKNNQVGSNGYLVRGPGEEVLLAQPGGNIFVEINSLAGNKIGIKNNCQINKSGQAIVFAAGDAFSEAFADRGSLTGSITVPEPIGAKGPNPVHGGCHTKKGNGNPGGGNGKGRWGQGNKGNGVGNIWTGNQGCGVGEGMTGGCKTHPCPHPKPEPEPEPEPEPNPEPEPEAPFAPVAPLLLFHIPRIEGCPELTQAAAAELGIPSETLQVGIGNALALNPSIQPCQACAALVNAASILRDEDGSRMAAMLEVFNALAPADAPFTPEVATSIVMALEGAAEGSQYASVAEYIDAFVQYVAVLDTELGSPVGDSVAFVMEKYGAGITGSDNANIGAFVVTCIESAETFGG